MKKNTLEDDTYLDELLQWGTIADIPRLIAEIRKLRKELAELKNKGS